VYRYEFIRWLISRGAIEHAAAGIDFPVLAHLPSFSLPGRGISLGCYSSIAKSCIWNYYRRITVKFLSAAGKISA
jgi:hypothetical protein